MPIPIRPFWPTLAQTLYWECKFITRHQATLTSVVAAVSPSDAAAVAAAFVQIASICALFISIQEKVDPNWKPK